MLGVDLCQQTHRELLLASYNNNLKKNLLISFLTFSLLSSQLGVNVYLIYCCCSKNLSYSFIPKSNSCKSKSVKKICCTKTSCSKSFAINKIPCGNKSIDHLSLNAKAERPSSNSFSIIDFFELPDSSSWAGIKNLSKNYSQQYFCNSNCNSGIQLRKLYCSFTC